MFVAVHVSLDFNNVPCSSTSYAIQNNKSACFVMGRGELFSFGTPNNRLLMALAECHAKLIAENNMSPIPVQSPTLVMQTTSMQPETKQNRRC